jgi:hypothetical protein
MSEGYKVPVAVAAAISSARLAVRAARMSEKESEGLRTLLRQAVSVEDEGEG